MKNKAGAQNVAGIAPAIWEACQRAYTFLKWRILTKLENKIANLLKE